MNEVRAPPGPPAAEVERLHCGLEREEWAAARISRRNVVTVHDVVAEDSRPWIVFSVTCEEEKETPTDEVSYPASG